MFLKFLDTLFYLTIKTDGSIIRLNEETVALYVFAHTNEVKRKAQKNERRTKPTI